MYTIDQLNQKQQLVLRPYLADESTLYCIRIDINERGSYIDGYFIITKTRAILMYEDEVTSVLKLSDFQEFTAVDMTSSGRLEGVMNGEPVQILYYSMEQVSAFAYAARILNELASGETPVVEPKDETKKCPKCGRPYMRRTKICIHCMSKSKTFQKIGVVIKPHWRLYVGIMALFFCNSFVLLYQPAVIRSLTDKVILPMANGQIDKNISGIIFYIVLIAICNVLVSAIAIARQYLTSIASAGMSRDLKALVYNKIQTLSISYLDEQTTGNIMNRISQDTNRVQHFIQNIATQALNELVLFVGVAIVLFVYNPAMAVLAIAPIPFVLGLSYLMRKRLRSMYKNQFQKTDKLNSLLNDILNGIRVVKAFGQEKRVISQFQNDAELVKNITTKVECFAYTIIPTIRFMMTASSILITLYGGSLVLNQSLGIGELLQFTTYASYLYNRLEWFSILPRWLSEAANAIERIFEVLDQDPEIETAKNPVKSSLNGNVSLERVTFGYKSYQPVLKDVSIDIKQGEMIGLVGHSGAGKSTVINLLMRLYDADEGNITIDGVDIKDLDPKSYKSQIGVVLQETFLFGGTILDNIRYAKPDASIHEVIRAAKIANAHDFIVKFPDGYDTRVGERGQRLSGGERQRIAIARAILTDPKILILDEATASVDTETEQQIQEALERLVKGRTTFAIAHRLSTLKHANRLMVMDKGKLKELGTHKELMDMQGIYYHLVTAQQEMSRIKAL